MGSIWNYLTDEQAFLLTVLCFVLQAIKLQPEESRLAAYDAFVDELCAGQTTSETQRQTAAGASPATARPATGRPVQAGTVKR